MGHAVIAQIDEEAHHPPDLTIDGVDTATGPHLNLTLRNDVLDDHPPVYRVWHDLLAAPGRVAAMEARSVSTLHAILSRYGCGLGDFHGQVLDAIKKAAPEPVYRTSLL
jgi:hypothetical protein